jgi:hypothetical protein
MGLADVCRLRSQALYRDEAVNEIDRRAVFTDDELDQVLAGRVATGMGEAAVQCILGRPSGIMTRVRRDEYDKIYRYEMPFQETRVHFSEGVVVDVRSHNLGLVATRRDLSSFVARSQSQMRRAVDIGRAGR